LGSAGTGAQIISLARRIEATVAIGLAIGDTDHPALARA
jgi:hypothetical protein